MRILLILLSLLLSANLYAQDEIGFIRKVVEKYEGHKSIHYDITYSFKSFDSEKPTVEPGNVSMIRNNTDSIFGASFLYEYELELNDTLKSYTKFYDLNNLVHDKKHNSLKNNKLSV